MIRKCLFVMAAPFALTSTIAIAQQQETSDPVEILISGGLTPIIENNFGRASTVITEQELAIQDERYVADVLRTVPGLSVSRVGSFGGLTQVRIRGNESNHTLVLIDGVEVNTVDLGEFDFGSLLTADIERIEILRGAQSSIYGSNAIGGVISITTKRATERGFSGAVSVDGGTDDTLAGLVALRQRFEQGGFSFSVAKRDTGGFDVSGSAGEDDEDDNETFNLTGDYEFTQAFRIGGSFRYTDHRSDFDAFNFGAATAEGLVTDSEGDFDDVEESFSSFFVELDGLGGRLRNRLSVGHAETDRVSHSGFFRTSDNTGERTTVTYLGSYALEGTEIDNAKQVLNFAVQYDDESFQENDPAIVFDPGQLEERERDQLGYVLEYQGAYDSGLDLQASVRYDDNDEFENETTYALGVSYKLSNDTTRIHASAGTGVQNPTLIEQFGFAADFLGNPDLEPEQSESFDLGVEQQFANGRGVVDLTYFNEELTDEISSVRDPITGLATPINQAGESDRDGFELSASYRFSSAFDASLSYTYLDASDPDGQVEVRRPKHDFYLQGTYRLPNDKTSITLGVQHVADLYDIDFKAASLGVDRVKLDDYTLVDLGLRHELTDTLTLTGTVTNLTDEDYQELEGYSAQGRTAFVGISARF